MSKLNSALLILTGVRVISMTPFVFALRDDGDGFGEGLQLTYSPRLGTAPWERHFGGGVGHGGRARMDITGRFPGVTGDGWGHSCPG